MPLQLEKYFKDSSRPWDKEIRDLVLHLRRHSLSRTLEELLLQLATWLQLNQ